MTALPRILWLARNLPVPANSGDRIYTARLVEAVAAAGSEVHYLGLANPEYPEMGADTLDPRVLWEIVPGKPNSTLHFLLKNRPVVGARFGTEAYAARIRQCLAEQSYDAIVVDQYGMAWTLPLIRARYGANPPPIVHIAHDFETDVIRSIAEAYRGNPVRKAMLHLNARRTAAAERQLALGCDGVVTLTAKDHGHFAEIGARGGPIVVPPGYDGARTPERTITADTPRQVAIVGSYRWIAKQMNLAAFLEAADQRFAEAGIKLLVVGDVPDEFRAQWEGRLRASRIVGFVDDLGELLDQCRMGLIVEAIGGGFKLKVLDYVMRRAPVAALSPAVDGQAKALTEHFLLRDEAPELVTAIIDIIDRVDQLNALQDGAYRVASPLFDWGANGRTLLSAILAFRKA